MKRMICILLTLCLFCGCQAEPPAQETASAETEQTAAPAAPVTEATETVTEEITLQTEPGFDPWAIADLMTTEELVGQLFLARCPSDETAVSDIQAYHLGGYILFGRDFENQTPDSVSTAISGYQAASKLPMLIAVDEEGGSVTRVSSNAAFRASRFPSPRKLYDEGGLALVLDTEAEKCQLLSSLGININMAPVCDITTEPDAFMYSRSLGQDPQRTGEYIGETVVLMKAYQIGAVLKHFPGYGNNTDTHVGIATDERSLESLESSDLVPFYAGIEAGCDAILVSHTFVNCLDEQLPASLSAAVIGYLRQVMGFEGVVVTDDLVMQAITDRYGTGEAAVLAVQAGNDLLCSSEYPQQYAAVLEAVNSGRIPLDQVKKSVVRILQWKYELGLFADS